MSQVLARHSPESFDGVVGSAGKGHGRPARQFLVQQALDGIDSLSMGDIARDVRVVWSEDPDRVVLSLEVAGCSSRSELATAQGRRANRVSCRAKLRLDYRPLSRRPYG